MKLREKFAASMMLFSLSILAPQVTNAASCGPRNAIIKKISTQFSAKPRMIALSNNNVMFETYVNDENQHWAIIGTTASGMSCVLAFGTAYEDGIIEANQSGEPMLTL